MINKDLLDAEGNIIGKISLPDSATESEIDAALKTYTEAPEIMDVTARQIRQALILSGVLLEQIDATIALLPEPIKSLAIVEWEYSNMFQRHRPLTIKIAGMLGWTDRQLDALWALAATL